MVKFKTRVELRVFNMNVNKVTNDQDLQLAEHLKKPAGPLVWFMVSFALQCFYFLFVCDRFSAVTDWKAN